MYGPSKVRGQWSFWFNRELYVVFKEPRSSVGVAIVRLWWAGRVARMDEICMPRRVMYMEPERLSEGRMTAHQVERRTFERFKYAGD
jgi:hypothetical protein